MQKSSIYKEKSDGYLTLCDYFNAAEKLFLNGKYVILNPKQQICSYQELFVSGRRKLCFLRNKKLQPGDIVIVDTSDVFAFISTFWACVWGGFVVVPIPPIVEPKNIDIVYELWQRLKAPLICTNKSKDISKTPVFDNNIIFIDEAKTCEPDFQTHSATANDLLLLLMTSGTTGKSKLAMHTQFHYQT